MLIETKTEVPARVSVSHQLKCDGCGAESKGYDSWPTDTYEADQVTIERVKKRNYPETGSSIGVAWDFCPKCFDEKVRPLLEVIAKPRKVEIDW